MQHTLELRVLVPQLRCHPLYVSHQQQVVPELCKPFLPFPPSAPFLAETLLQALLLHRTLVLQVLYETLSFLFRKEKDIEVAFEAFDEEFEGTKGDVAGDEGVEGDVSEERREEVLADVI